MRDDGNVVSGGLSTDFEDCKNREDLVEEFASCKNGSRALTLCQAAEPHDVRLENVDGAVLDQLAEAATSVWRQCRIGMVSRKERKRDPPVTRVLVLSRRPLDLRHPLLQQLVAVKVVRVKDLQHASVQFSFLNNPEARTKREGSPPRTS